ncbi:DUF3322 domain-containing protein [Glutamicibacter halophytocola]|uniref:DUF3322 domain-containing protein n=1 Tax=Glutamicibacter halophytocola TaxID=1933880 RepID=UPI00321B980B
MLPILASLKFTLLDECPNPTFTHFEGFTCFSNFHDTSIPCRVIFGSGANEVPQAIWFDTVQDELAFLGKREEGKRFLRWSNELSLQEPTLLAWASARPFQLLELREGALTAAKVARWLVQNLSPRIYVRQLAIAGVHTKFVEGHVRVIDEMAAELSGMPAPRSSTMKSFKERWKFTTEPGTIRIRGLGNLLNAPGSAEDLEIPVSAFAAMGLAVHTVIVTENRTNFLALPLKPGTLVAFGAGYGMAGLSGCPLGKGMQSGLLG